MKKILQKTAASFLLVAIFFTFFPVLAKSKAASQFSTGYDISFVFEESGQTRVTHKISLTNLTTDFYASEYSLTISSKRVSEVSGSDGLGAINVTTKTQNESTVLVAVLNQKVVGQNKTVQFQISYLTDSLAVKRGRIWEINIPQIVTSENVSGYRLAVSVPANFGKLGKMSPTPDQVEEASNRTNYIFTKNSVKSSGIGGTFGDYQLFKFKLVYRYKNSNFQTARASIALPPDTEYQALHYENIDPKPISMDYDESGNYLAFYNVKGGSTLEVITTGVVQIFNSDSNLQKPHSWTKAELEKFTQNDKYIDSNNQLIQKKAKELKNIAEIYDFVATTLKYDYSRLENDSLGRRGSLQALTKPEDSICTDFADLFVALARAKGIPARGLVGFAYTDNTNLRPTKVEGLIDTTVLHAWAEYYDKEKSRWVQVDPTWEATTGGIDYFNKLDTNHFVFVINGTKSTSPIPAGGYKTAENQTDDVKVEFADKLPTVKPDFNITLDRDVIVSGFPGRGEVTIENRTGRALFAAQLDLTGGTVLNLINPERTNADLIMPFEKKDFKVQLRSNSLIDYKNEILKFKLIGKVGSADYSKEQTKTVIVRPFFSVNLEQIILTIMLFIVLISHLIPRFYHKKPQSQ